MNNKQMLFWVEAHESLMEFLAMDVGKSVKAELKAIREANGGAKKLAEADRVLAAAKKVYDERVAAGNEEARRAVRIADDMSKGVLADIKKKEAGLAKLKDDLSRQSIAATERARQYKNAAKLLDVRENAVREGAADNEALKRRLDATATRLTRLDQELDARAKRFKEAAA